MNLTDAKDLFTIIGVVAALATLVKGLWEYRRAGVLKRIEYFAKMKEQFLKDTAFVEITERLEAELLKPEDSRLGEIESRDKWRYLSFFEEVALLLRARLIRKELACYMFGYYALLCDRSHSFWCDSFPKNEAYWSLFFDFVAQMRPVERSKHVNRKAFIAKIGA